MYSFFWRWLDQGYEHTSRDLTQLLVRTRVAWQRPEAVDYEYHLTPQALVGHSALETMRSGGGCYSLPWEFNWWVNGVLAEVINVVRQPWNFYNPTPFTDVGPWLIIGDTDVAKQYVVRFGGSSMQPAQIKAVSYAENSSAVVEERGSAAASGVVETELFGVQMSPEPVIFLYGGQTKSLSGAPEYSNALWIGFPTHENNLWLKAEDVYGVEAGTGPLLAEPKMLYHARNARLIVVGNRISTRGENPGIPSAQVDGGNAARRP